MRYETYPCIGIISGTSFVMSTAIFAMVVVVDYTAFMREISREDRSLNRLRWELLVITPVEDIVRKIITFQNLGLHVKIGAF